MAMVCYQLLWALIWVITILHLSFSILFPNGYSFTQDKQWQAWHLYIHVEEEVISSMANDLLWCKLSYYVNLKKKVPVAVSNLLGFVVC